VRLTAADVAEEIYAATHPKRSWRPTVLAKVHYPVGRQTKVLAGLAQVSPAWMSRLLNKIVTRT